MEENDDDEEPEGERDSLVVGEDDDDKLGDGEDFNEPDVERDVRAEAEFRLDTEDEKVPPFLVPLNTGVVEGEIEEGIDCDAKLVTVMEFVTRSVRL